MRLSLVGTLGFGLCLWVTSDASALAHSVQTIGANTPLTGSISYQIKPGDTLIGLSEAYLRTPSDYGRLQSHNRIANPRRLRVGQNLSLPVSLLRTTPEQAVVTHFRGQVQINNATPSQGQIIAEGARVTTGANAFIRLRLSDGSHVVVPSNSRVRLNRLRRYVINDAMDHDFQVERGRMESQVTPRRAPGGYRITTPVSVSAVRGTDFRVAYDEDTATAATEVLTGRVEVDSLNTSERDEITADLGVTAASGGLTRVTLLPAPRLTNPKAILTGDEAVVEVAALDQARQYRGRLGLDAGMVDALSEAETAPGSGQLYLGDLEDGLYYLRLSALSDKGVEGRSTTYTLIRLNQQIKGLAAQQLGDPALRAYRFKWEPPAPSARPEPDTSPITYRFTLHREGPDGAIIDPALVDRPGLSETNFNLTGLADGVYNWRVQISQHRFGQLIETWSEPQQLHIGQ